ncbi:uncharacterized protein LOC123684295 isoform X3 [Harmonia axyridis]|uniref:uncharacterized protein LOC123684295 isoform X3 n=1 Tax=Harmonia axyridis TaxID=115357 RepID=UPI001E2751A0|nr:uncharacterized protein LOC123684295 isoform X3 [Harmonia axyridis]
MEERLYLFEVLIDSIYFDDCVSEIPQKKQIVVSVKLGNIVTLEIRSETLPNRGEGGNKRIVDFKSGRSYLAPLLQEELLQALDTQGLEVTVGVRGDVVPLGTSSAPWDDCFKEMVQASHEEFVTPVSINDDFCLIENGVIKGNVQMFLRLSCFGKNIQTHVEVLQEGGNRQFLFKSPNMATTFICSKYGAGTSTDFLPVGALYNAGNIHKGAASGTNKAASWTAMVDQQTSFFEKRSSVQSECLFPEYLNIVPPVKDSAITFDIVSLRARPEEEKFLDFLTGKKFGDITDSIHSFSIADEEGNERIIYYFDDSKKDTAAGTKESKACQCPKTPVYCKHVYAAIEKYEKTHPDIMVFGKKVKYDKLQKSKEASLAEKSDSILRLRGGHDKEEPYVHKKTKGCYNPCCRMAFKLRSVGKSQVEENNPVETKDDYFCADFFCPENNRRNVALQVKFSEDDVPSSYICRNRYCPAAKMFKKLGLGPLATERCQGCLYGPVRPPVQYGLSQTYGTFDTYGPYGIFFKTNTPYMQGEGRTLSKKRPVLRLRGGGAEFDSSESDPSRLRGGAPWKSPIVECQEIMEQFDKILGEYRTALESGNKKERDIEEYMEPSTTANCGHPRCTYISEPALKPIHWDCPEPLPIGICRNPKCPYLPEDLKRIGRILASRGHYQEETNTNYHTAAKSTPEFTRQTNYSGQQCPFYNPPKIVNMMQFCNLSLPNMKQSNSCCSNPNCPLKGIVSSCSNPDCPFAHGVMGQACSNPDCPFRQASFSAPCSNPDCPLRKGDLSEPCSNPECPFKGSNISEACSNPDCPFKNASTPGGRVSEESCHNPDCPFKKKSESVEVCENPDCPFKTKESTAPVWADLCDLTTECKCNNPNCPAQKEICSNPECPFNIEKPEVCGNPNCPYKSQPSAKKKGICGSLTKSFCGDKTCPFHEGAGEEKEEGEKGQQSTIGGGDGLASHVKDEKIKVQGTAIEEGALEITKGDRPSHYDMVPCTLATCKFMGGKLKCEDCATLTEGRRHAPCPKICPGDVKCPLAISGVSTHHKDIKKPETTKRALRKARKQFAYHFGDNYPGIHMGHKHCVISPFNVPPKMGWLWNVHTPCLQLRI